MEANAHRDASVLLSNAVLVCQYGGIITIVDVLSGNEDDENKGNLLEQLSTEYIEWLIKAEGTKLYPYIDERIMMKLNQEKMLHWDRELLSIVLQEIGIS